jgi:hypothetical protein
MVRLFVELHGGSQATRTGAGGLMFMVDGKQVTVSSAILAHSHRTSSCGFARCTVTWNIGPDTPAEKAALVAFVKAVSDGHEVYATLFPADSGGQRFSVKLTDEQLLGFHDIKQYYDSLTLVKKVITPATVTQQ